MTRLQAVPFEKAADHHVRPDSGSIKIDLGMMARLHTCHCH